MGHMAPGAAAYRIAAAKVHSQRPAAAAALGLANAAKQGIWVSHLFRQHLHGCCWSCEDVCVLDAFDATALCRKILTVEVNQQRLVVDAARLLCDQLEVC
jgi:hypothetical protein